MDIEVERSPSLQEGKPDRVYVKLIDDQGDVKAWISVLPYFCHPGDPRADKFWIEINSGHSLLDRPINIKLLV